MKAEYLLILIVVGLITSLQMENSMKYISAAAAFATGCYLEYKTGTTGVGWGVLAAFVIVSDTFLAELIDRLD